MDSNPVARLRELREAKALSLDDLSKLSGVHRSLIYAYERGVHMPRQETIAKLSVALGVRSQMLALPEPKPELNPVFLRHLKTKTPAKYLTAVHRQLPRLRDFVAGIDEYVVLPVVNIPDYSPPSDPMLIKDEEIEEAAIALRVHWGLRDGVIRDLIRLVEKNGCVVIPEVVKWDAIDAFSQWSSNGRPMIVVNAPTIKGVRWRMDVAHELGHLVMHRNIDKRFIEINPSTHALIERQAFRFGSAFLMPESSFRKSIPYVSLDTLLLAKEYWFLAVAAMLHRAEDLQMISSESARRMWRNRNRRGWRIEEPLDHALPLDEPRVLASAIRTLIDSNPNLVEELSDQVGLEKEEIARFAGVPVSMLEPDLMLDIHTPIRNRGDLRVQA